MSREMSEGASQGQSLAGQMERYPQLVPPHVRGMILAAERSGTLPEALQELAEELRAQQTARWKMMVGSIWLGLMVFVGVAVVPLTRRLFLASAAAFESYNATEPPLRQFLRVAIPVAREWLFHTFLPTVMVLLVALLASKLIAGLPRLQRPVQRLLYRVPIIGNLVRRAATIRFLVSLQGLMQAGVEVQEGLALAAEATGDAVMTEQLQAAAARIRAGRDLTTALAPCTCVTREVKDGLALAERAGTYDRTLQGLTTGARASRLRTVALSAVFGYSLTLVLSAAFVLYVLYNGWNTYFNTILNFTFE
jgi:type IV pilus assembly protein PilC